MTGAAAHRDNALVGRAEAGGLERLALDVAGVRRTYWLARAQGSTRLSLVPRHLDASEILLYMVTAG